VVLAAALADCPNAAKPPLLVDVVAAAAALPAGFTAAAGALAEPKDLAEPNELFVCAKAGDCFVFADEAAEKKSGAELELDAAPLPLAAPKPNIAEAAGGALVPAPAASAFSIGFDALLLPPFVSAADDDDPKVVGDAFAAGAPNENPLEGAGAAAVAAAAAGAGATAGAGAASAGAAGSFSFSTAPNDG
jgi:hypothetical protein